MRVIMLVMSDVAGDARVLREAATISELGHTVHIIGKDVPVTFVPPDGVTVTSARGGRGLKPRGETAQSGRRAPLPAHLRVARWFLLPQHRNAVTRQWRAQARQAAAAVEYDLVHAHDYNTLELGAELAEAKGTRLVYDAHEYWSGRPRYGRPAPFQHLREIAQERQLGARADVVLTVSDGIARRFEDQFGWRHVSVVRNTFPRKPARFTQIEAPRGVVYAGRIGEGRDLETVAAAAEDLAPLRVTVAGPRDETFLSKYFAANVQIREALPLAEVDRLIAAEGLALVTLADRSVNHRLAMPNKLFHAVRMGVPVVATDLPEIGRCVRTYGIGTLYRAGDPASLVEAVREAIARYPELVRRVQVAAPQLSWEVDAKVLRGVYDKLARQ
jgi:glycosyltransferase involved in cell wall biosynthesis